MKIYGLLNSSEQIVDESTGSTSPDGYIEMQEPRPTNNHVAQIDGKWIYVEPVKEIQAISKRQAMLQLNAIGLYNDLIEFINQAENKTLKIDFEYSNNFERNSPVVLDMAKQFNLSSEQVDNLFREAIKL